MGGGCLELDTNTFWKDPVDTGDGLPEQKTVGKLQ